MEQTQAPSYPLGNTASSFLWNKTAADEATSVSYDCGQQQDERTALSNALINDVVKCEPADDTGEDDVLCDLLSRHRNDVGFEMFEDAGEVVIVQPIDDAEMQNSCDQVTDSSSWLKFPGAKKTYTCSVCHKTFGSSSFLASRLHIHTITCVVCQRQFTQHSSFKTHMLTHTDDERSHKCDMCHKQFTQRGHLDKHVLTHTGERPHKCDVCRKQFYARCHLNKHMLRHTGERPHKCDVSSAVYSTLPS